MTRRRFAILTRADDRFRERHYLVQPMIPLWSELGIETVVTSEEDEPVDADAALLHVDLTVIPDACLRAAERYPRVLNGRVRDIRKRTFSTSLVTREGDDPGPVFVKTDWNCGGRAEFRAALLGSRPGRLMRALGLGEFFVRVCEELEEERSWARRRWIHTADYQRFASRADVPAAVWRNKNLVVERFLAEREGEDFCCRHWVFFGARERHSRTRSSNVAVKGRLSVTPLEVPVPDELRKIRERLGFDYGKFDYGVVDGQLVLYDVNRTPGTASDPSSHAAAIAELAPALRAWLP
jgi:hypothetical protein